MLAKIVVILKKIYIVYVQKSKSSTVKKRRSKSSSFFKKKVSKVTTTKKGKARDLWEIEVNFFVPTKVTKKNMGRGPLIMSNKKYNSNPNITSTSISYLASSHYILQPHSGMLQGAQGHNMVVALGWCLYGLNSLSIMLLPLSLSISHSSLHH